MGDVVDFARAKKRLRAKAVRRAAETITVTVEDGVVVIRANGTVTGFNLPEILL